MLKTISVHKDIFCFNWKLIFRNRQSRIIHLIKCKPNYNPPQSAPINFLFSFAVGCIHPNALTSRGDVVKHRYIWGTCEWLFLSITMTSKYTQWRLKSPALRLFTQLFIRAQIKENIKAPRHWHCAGNSPVTGEFPPQMASNADNVSIWWRHHAEIYTDHSCFENRTGAKPLFIIINNEDLH